MTKFITIFFAIALLLVSCAEYSKSELPKDFNENRKKLMNVLRVFKDANQISAGLSIIVDTLNPGPEKEMEELMILGIRESKNISNEFLDYLHPELADNFRNKLVKSNELYIDGFRSQFGDSISSVKKQLQANILLFQWEKFWNDNIEQISKKISAKPSKSFGQKIQKVITANKSKLSYWRMFLRFIISDFVVVAIFSLIVLFLLLPILPFGLLQGKINSTVLGILMAPFLLIGYIGQVYFWLLWAAYCATTVELFISRPSVEFAWIYYVTGFIFVSGPIGYLTKGEAKSRKTYEEQERVKRGGSYFGLIAILGYIIFCVWSDLKEYPFLAWVNAWLYN